MGKRADLGEIAKIGAKDREKKQKTVKKGGKWQKFTVNDEKLCGKIDL